MDETTRFILESRMEKLAALFDTFKSNYTDSEEVFETIDFERQVQILLTEGVFDHLLQQVLPTFLVI